MTFGDALAAARKGAREWARSIGITFLSLVGEGAPIANVSPLRHVAWIGKAFGELLGRVDDALADDDLTPTEARSLLKDVAHVEARLVGLKRLLEQKARSQ